MQVLEKNRTHIMQTIASRKASNRFGNLLNVVEKGTIVTVTRNNREAAIMLSPQDFQLMGGETSLLAKKQERMKQNWERISHLKDQIQKEAEKNGLTEDVLNHVIHDR